MTQKTKIHQHQAMHQDGITPVAYIDINKYENSPYFHDVMQKLTTLSKTDGRVNKIFNDFTAFYLNRVLNGQAAKKNKIKLSHQYLLHELTLFGLLNQDGYHAMIYPGRIATISDTLDLNISFLDKLFEEFHYVSIRLNKR